MRLTRRYAFVGLSGWRKLNEDTDGAEEREGRAQAATQKTPAERFLTDPERKLFATHQSMFEWASRCGNVQECRCNVDHVPVFTGVPTWPTWPLGEDYCKGQLKIHAPGTWHTEADLLGHHTTFVDAFSAFFEITAAAPAPVPLVTRVRLVSPAQPAPAGTAVAMAQLASGPQVAADAVSVTVYSTYLPTHQPLLHQTEFVPYMELNVPH